MIEISNVTEFIINENRLVLDGFTKRDEKEYILEREGIYTTLSLRQETDRVTLFGSIENKTSKDIHPGDFRPYGEIKLQPGDFYDKIHTTCRDMLGFCGIQNLDRDWTSFGVCGFTDGCGERAATFGFADLSNYFCSFEVSKKNEEIFIVPVVSFEKFNLMPGEKVKLPALVIIFGGFLTDLLKEQGKYLLKNMSDTEKEFASQPTGFCSWYTHYGTESFDDIKSIVSEYEKSPISQNLEYFLIDGGWNEDIGQDEYNWGDWETKSKFSKGMKHVSDYIHSKKFKSGLWLAPFAITSNSKVYKEHPDWVIGKGEDLMNNGGEAYGLDLTNPQVKDFVKNTVSRIFEEWDFDYIKIDFLLYGALVGERYDNRKTSAQAFREGLKIIRECAGERLVLNCGSPLFQSIGYCDAMRIGPDVGSQCFFPLNEQVWQYGNCCVKAGMRYTMFNHWMDRMFWYNDPDCIVARSRSNGIEYKEFLKFFPGMDIREERFGLSENEFLAFVKLVWFTKGLYFLSDVWSNLEKTRRCKLIRFSIPFDREVTMVDYYMHRDVCVFKTVSNPLYIAVFNIGDSFENLSLPSHKIGIDNWDFSEITQNIKFKGQGKTINFPKIPPRSGYIFKQKL